jgi:hypothetical protein
MNASPGEGNRDEEIEVWTPRTHQLHWPRNARIPVPTLTVVLSLEALQSDAAMLARCKRVIARDVVRAAADAKDAAAVAAAAVSAVADIADSVGAKRALPFAPIVAPHIDVPNVD